MKIRFFLMVLLALSASALPRVVLVTAEDEYHTAETLPAFFEQNFAGELSISVVGSATMASHSLDNASLIKGADLLVLSVWRRALPPEQLALIRGHIAAGRPIVAIRTASHGFVLRPGQDPLPGREQWPEFDAEILGCHYDGHFGGGKGTSVQGVAAAGGHAIMSGVKTPFSVRSWLYKSAPLAADATLLLEGNTPDSGGAQPLAWVRALPSGSRVFYTSMGHPEDFLVPGFCQLLRNGTCWALNQPIPKTVAGYEPWGAAWEQDQLFCETPLDARAWGGDFPGGNLAVRGLVVRIGDDLFGCYDTDLVRLAAVWRGAGVNETGMAAGSYAQSRWNKKADAGQKKLPSPIGEPLLGLALLPGAGAAPLAAADPRPAGADARDVGRGAVDGRIAAWGGVRLSAEGPVCFYTADGIAVEEMLQPWSEGKGIARVMRRAAGTRATLIRLGSHPAAPAELTDSLAVLTGAGGKTLYRTSGGTLRWQDGTMVLELPAADDPVTVTVAIWHGNAAELATVRQAAMPTGAISDVPAKPRWPEHLITRSVTKQATDNQYILEDIDLPTPNPWRRNVRPAGIDFFPDGRAAIATFDGDIWIVDGLDKNLKTVGWKRFAAGLSEPMNLAVVDGGILVFSRNGIIRLRDDDGDGEADRYETFCNAFPQSAETREFPLDIVKNPGGGFYIAKGSQHATYVGSAPGTVFSISADGKSVHLFADGLREPFLGIHPRTGLLVASDQQGHWIPSTPVHILRPNGWYGYLSALEKDTGRQPEPTTLWHPHRFNSSSVGLVWGDEKRFGPLSGQLICLDYRKPGLVVMDWDDKTASIGGAFGLEATFASGILHAAVNPVDGQLYVAGMQIFDSSGVRTASFTRMRFVGGKNVQALPLQVRAFQEGILLKWSGELAPAAEVVVCDVHRWNYLRSGKYGSPQFGLDGKTGQDVVAVQSVTLSDDKHGLFVRLADMLPCMQLAITLDVPFADGSHAARTFWLTPAAPPPFDAKGHGFPPLRGPVAVAHQAVAVVKPTVALGGELAVKYGCIGCHSQDGTTEGRTGPTWKGIAGSPRTAEDGATSTADEAYLRQAILDPTAFVLKGFSAATVGMPPYAGILKNHEVDSLILYIQTLVK